MKFVKLLFVGIILFITSCSSYNNTYVRGGGYGSYYSKRTLKTGKVITVRKKDTVYALSRRYNVPVKDIIAINNLRPPLMLKEGQKIVIPKVRVHIVSNGDTLYSVSRKYGVDLSSLARVNKIRYPYKISKGQKLALPGTVMVRNTSYSGKGKTPTYSKNSYSRTKKTYKKSNVKPINVTEKRSSKYNFAWPVKGKVIATYGKKGNGIHNDGINIKGKKGDHIISAENGVIAYSGNELKGFGNLILIKHSDGFMTAYAHTDKVLVKKGQNVKRGDKIATVGKSGSVKDYQLHFKIRKDSKALDPLKYLEK